MNANKAAIEFARASKICRRQGDGKRVNLFADGRITVTQSREGYVDADGKQHWPITHTLRPLTLVAANRLITETMRQRRVTEEADPSDYADYRLNSRELATVLAALRHWQETMVQAMNGGQPPTRFESYFEDVTAMTVEQVDELAERLNFT